MLGHPTALTVDTAKVSVEASSSLPPSCGLPLPEDSYDTLASSSWLIDLHFD